MPKTITIDLIRRKAEHNEGLIHTLEELSLHQEELESIDETLGCNCRRLKILYLQNNIIGEMRNLHHMKELEYLNLALNNIAKVEGLQSCEFLNKLDLTVNFIDLDELESSVTAMEGNRHLGDLYMMGNPCQSWPGFEAYVIARLPQLERLDGKEITRTDRIKALQRLPALREEMIPLAEAVRQRKRAERQAARQGDQEKKNGDGDGGGRECADGGGGGGGSGSGHPPAPGKSDGTAAAAAAAVATTAGPEDEGKMVKGSGGGGSDGNGNGDGGVIGEEELTKHTPEVRTAIYREMAEQKKEKEDRQRENLPKDRDFDLEQTAAVERARKREAEGAIMQCNEGRLQFRFEETRAGGSSPEPGMGMGKGTGTGAGRKGSSGGDIVLEVAVPKYLDSSLIDLDVHPHYVSVVIKGKVLRLSLQAEVKAGEARARRSKTTGSLVVTMPKVDPHQSIGLLPTSGGRRAPGVVADRAAASKSATRNDVGRTKRRGGGAPTLAAQMLEEAQAAAAAKRGTRVGGGEAAADAPREAVSIRGMVGPRHGGVAVEEETAPQLTEVASTAKRAGTSSVTVTDNNGTGNASTTATSAVGSRTPPPEESPSLPTPPPRLEKPESPSKMGGKTAWAGPAPPAPPSGGSVPREGGSGVGAARRVVWPSGLDEDESLSRLDQLD